MEKTEKYLPKYVSDTLPSSLSNRNLSALVLYDLNAKSKAELEALPEVSEGLENRLKSALTASSSYESLVENVKTKRYTMAKIKRILLYSLLKIDKAALQRLTEAKPYFNFWKPTPTSSKRLPQPAKKASSNLKTPRRWTKSKRKASDWTAFRRKSETSFILKTKNRAKGKRGFIIFRIFLNNISYANKKIVVYAFALGMIALLLVKPEVYTKSVFNGLILFAMSVLPGMFPFFFTEKF